MDNVREFEAAVADAMGVEVSVVLHGDIQRFSTNGKPSDKSGWLIFHGDYGAFGDWRQDFKGTWSAERGHRHDPQEKRNREIHRISRQLQQHNDWLEAAERALQIWSGAQDVPTNDETGGHPYLRAKMVEPLGIRQSEGNLLIPMIDHGNHLWSLQFIDPAGAKLFFKGGRVRHMFHIIEGDPARVAVCEGYATGAAIYKLTGQTVYCAFNAGNLGRAAWCARARHRSADLSIWGDDDKRTEGNPGRTKAEAVAKDLDVKIYMPDFSRFAPHSHPNPTDWADYLLMEEGQWAL